MSNKLTTPQKVLKVNAARIADVIIRKGDREDRWWLFCVWRNTTDEELLDYLRRTRRNDAQEKIR